MTSFSPELILYGISQLGSLSYSRKQEAFKLIGDILSQPKAKVTLNLAQKVVQSLERCPSKISMRATTDCIAKLFQLNHTDTLRAIEILSQNLSDETPSRYTTRLSGQLLKITLILASQTNLSTSSDVKILNSIHFYLVKALYNYPAKALIDSIRSKLFSFWLKNSEIYSAVLSRLNGTAVNNAIDLCMADCVSIFMLLNKSAEQTAVEQFITRYSKALFASRTQPPSFLHHCFSLLSLVSHQQFKAEFLPAIQKAMLRNPEIIADSVAYVIRNVKLDLSTYSLELTKCFGPHLRCKDLALKDSALMCVDSLSRQCSDVDAISNGVDYLFGVLSGSEGKLTSATDRQTVLSAIGALSQHIAPSQSSSVQDLHLSVTLQMCAVIKQEVHEGTLVHAVSQMQRWSSQIRSIPTNLIEELKVLYSQKMTNSVTRRAYFECLKTMFKGQNLSSAEQFVPLFLEAVERATKAAANQPTVVSEALNAAIILQRLSVTSPTFDVKLTGFWKSVLDENKQLFTSNTVLDQANEEALLSCLEFTDTLLTVNFQKIGSEVAERPYLRVFIRLLSAESYKVRNKSRTAVGRILGGLGGAPLLPRFLDAYRSYITELDNKASDSFETGPTSQRLWYCLQSLLHASAVDSQHEGASLALLCETLYDCHHPRIVESCPVAWTKMLLKFNISVERALEKCQNKIRKSLNDGSSFTMDKFNAVKTIIRFSKMQFLTDFFDDIASSLRNPQFTKVTDREYAIYLTPPNELYNKKVLESVKTEEPKSNVKRENKLYSYKEQMLELELRKELQAKKQTAKTEEVKLTAKGRELMEAELHSEAEIRNNLTEIATRLDKIFLILEACRQGDNKRFCLNFYKFLDLLSVDAYFSSPLTSSRFVCFLVALCSDTFSSDRIYGNLVAYAGLRSVFCPNSAIDPAWCEEPKDTQLHRAILLAHKKVFLSSKQVKQVSFKPKSSQSTNDPTLLNCAQFSAIFPLLRHVLDQPTADLESSHCMHALNLLVSHCRLKNEDSLNLTHPRYLPRYQMFELLCICLRRFPNEQSLFDAMLWLAEICSSEHAYIDLTERELRLLLSCLEETELDDRRKICLQTLDGIHPTAFAESSFLIKRLYVSKFDHSEEVSQLAKSLYAKLHLTITSDYVDRLVDDLISAPKIHLMTSLALRELLKKFPEERPIVLQRIVNEYKEFAKPILPILDEFGRPISELLPDPWGPRMGLAVALKHLAPQLEDEMLLELFNFFVKAALDDRREEVRLAMFDAALVSIEIHGKPNVEPLLHLFDEFLETAPDDAQYDTVRQSIVILMGTLARHLESDDPRIRPIFNKLITALSIPSEQVQQAVAKCLPHLIPSVKADAQEIVEQLLLILLNSDKYGARKGAAFGLAGVVKGLGMSSLKQLEIMQRLETAVQNKKVPKQREGALLAFETLCITLGRLYEPYIVHILPYLLLCFGDGDPYVRKAAEETSRAVMANLSGHGVKLVLPALLAALDEDSWRTKAGSVELLGAMSHCAPKQLSACLPTIVPRLVEVLSDSHIRVQSAGTEALKQIGSVIKNPEIEAITDVLLAALQDPTKKTTTCLATLLNTKFVHYIDAASLALIMPVVRRAFQDRAMETRKMASQIIGNMYNLTDMKDLQPYLSTVIPGLKQCLLDPVPEVRSVAAQALGRMVSGLGETGLADIVPWLREKLVSEQSSVDRSGAAQGLAEVCGGLGIQRLQSLMADIVQTAERQDLTPNVRDGYLMMYIYLPPVFGDSFTDFVGPIIPSILMGLSDESEYVRETALKAGQRIIDTYAETSVTLLLPQLETGLFDTNWRIRYCSVQLLGDLLYKLTGVSGKQSTETGHEDETFGTETAHKTIREVLGVERRNRVIAGLYMGRSDVALSVSQAASHVWKIVVVNTPRMVREILPTLFSLLLGFLASEDGDKREIAARTLGDVVRKLGERVLPEIIPILEEGLQSKLSEERQGVCFGLSEIMAATDKEHVLLFADSLIPTIRSSLSDPLPEVREAAAQTFSNLHDNLGTRALDDVLPHLLNLANESEVSEYALSGLKQVVAVKSRVVLTYLVPQLISPIVNSRVLAVLSEVAGDSLSKHLPRVISAMLNSLAEKIDTDSEADEIEFCRTVLMASNDPQSTIVICTELLEGLAVNTTHFTQVHLAAAILTEIYCSETTSDYSDYIQPFYRTLFVLLANGSDRQLKTAWDAANAITKNLDEVRLQQHIPSIRHALRNALNQRKPEDGLLEGLCIPGKGIDCVLPIFREGIFHGSSEVKEAAATGIGEIINTSSAKALEHDVSRIAGPLIRILGERFSPSVKVALLNTLALFMCKTSLTKALSDSAKQVRLKAGFALKELASIEMKKDKIDRMVTDVTNLLKKNEDSEMRETSLQAARLVISVAGSGLKPATTHNLLSVAQQLSVTLEDLVRTCAAACVGVIFSVLPDTEKDDLFIQFLTDVSSNNPWTTQHGHAVALAIALKEDIQSFDQKQTSAESAALNFASADRVPVCLSGIQSLAYLISAQLKNGKSPSTSLCSGLVSALKHQSNDVKIYAAKCTRFCAQVSRDSAYLSALTVGLIDGLLVGCTEKNTGVRYAMECALGSLLRLGEAESAGLIQNVMSRLEPVNKDALAEIVEKSLRKQRSITGSDVLIEEIDETLLK